MRPTMHVTPSPTMVHMPFYLGMFLAASTPTLASISSTVPVLSHRENLASCYFGGHRPTAKAFTQGLAQYCNNHVGHGIRLKDREELVVTMILEDSKGCPISWIYKMWWEDNADNGSIDISQDLCQDNFDAFVDKEDCTNGEKKFVVGGKINHGVPGKPNSKLWFETRQRKDDVYPQTCNYVRT